MNKNKSTPPVKKLKGSSLNKQEEILEFMRSKMPEIFSEGKVDCQKLKQTLGEEINDQNERYGLSWAGKSNCFREIQETTTATLKPNEKESVDFEKTGNLFIEGDNLEVLKVLQRSYYGKIKCIYIDPPYNTGNDFIYNDNFRKTRKEELEDSGEMNENGDLTRADGLSVNRKDSNGHFHSDWLNMMYPRLFLARNLLRQDGVIFVSIDYNEVANLRLIMDEIFGEENFVEYFSWVKTSTPPGLSNKSRKTVEYILCYEKNLTTNKFKGELLDGGDQPLLNSGNSSRILKFPKEVVKFNKDGQYKKGQYDRVILKDDIEIVDGYSNADFSLEGEFKWIQDTLNEEIKNGTSFIIKSDKLAIRFIRNEDGGYKAPTNLIKDKYISPVLNKNNNNIGTNESASSELEILLDGRYFDFPKPISLLKHIINFCVEGDDIILDFFSGSGTTAHAVMDLNAEDGGNRKYICVQLPELCEENSEAYKAGYKTIAEISKERIRRAGKKIKEEKENIDVGFKSFKLDKSNFKIWSHSVKTPRDKQEEQEEQERLFNALDDFVDNLTKGSEEKNILFELILKSGLDLNVTVAEKEFEGEKYYDLSDGELLVYLGEKISKEMGEFFQSQNPEKIICLERAFQNDDELKANILLQAEQEDIDFKVV